MKTKKTLKFSKETVIVLDQNAKKTVKGGELDAIKKKTIFPYDPRPACKQTNLVC